ncbi:hypothetical protein ACHWQZ_G002924 [Mnemiopsis leidyi]
MSKTRKREEEMGRKKQEDIGMYALVVNSDQEVLSPTESVKSEYDANFDMMSLTDTQVNMFRDIFNMYDKDGNNTIDCSELKLILEELGYECSTEEVMHVISKFDINTTGTIDFNEFLSLVGDWMSNDENQIRDAFEVFDKEGNGYLSLEQLKRALTMYGEAFTDAEAEEFFKEIDVDGDGTITADEFIQYIKGVNS